MVLSAMPRSKDNAPPSAPLRKKKAAPASHHPRGNPAEKMWRSPPLEARTREEQAAPGMRYPGAKGIPAFLRAGLFVLLALFSLYCLVALLSAQLGQALPGNIASDIVGLAGSGLAKALFFVLGYVAYLLPPVVLMASWVILYRQSKPVSGVLAGLRLAGGGLALLGLSSIAQLSALPTRYAPFEHAGGGLGKLSEALLLANFGFLGGWLAGLGMLLFGGALAGGFSWSRGLLRLRRGCGIIGGYLLAALRASPRGLLWMLRQAFVLGYGLLRLPDRLLRKLRHRTASPPEAAPDVLVQPADEALSLAAKAPTPGPREEKARPLAAKAQAKGREIEALQLPSPELLDKSTAVGASERPEEVERIARELEAKLLDFRVEARVTGHHVGPVITCFELQPAAGIKASTISGLAKDLARSLAVQSVRVVELIPGKSVVGLEIPNRKRVPVVLRDLLRAPQYQETHSPLTLALGMNSVGTPYCVDLAALPHLLVAGTTGAGKSVAVNVMLLSLLYRAPPEEVRLLLVDPKMLELSVYQDIPHLLAPVITDAKEATKGLRWCVAEMDRRYRLMNSCKVRHLRSYNDMVRAAQKAGTPLPDPLAPQEEGGEEALLEVLPYIVVCIDEFADMIMLAGKEVEHLIVRVAQKARAAGIHLVLATQRPSVNVITGLIKANIPGRIAFQVAARVDSRTILDQGGAEQLLGAGDMLYLPPGTSMPERIHGAFVSDEEVKRVVSHWKEQAAPRYVAVLEDEEAELGGDPSANSDEGSQDPMYDEAVSMVQDSRRASASAVQRRFRIGYNRAARLLEAMEIAGVVTPADAAGKRKVLLPPRTDE